MSDALEIFKQEVDSKLKNFESELTATQKDVEKVKNDMQSLLAEQRTSTELVKEMHGVLIGNEQYGVRGYKQRLENVESTVTDLKKNPPPEEKKTKILGFELTAREKLFLLVGVLLATSGWATKVLSVFGLGA